MQPLVVVPTYQEAENIVELITGIRSECSGAHVLVVDDGSPDGTADRAELLAAQLDGVDVLRRPRKSGLGTAYHDGFCWGLDRGYDVLVSMDADLSHDPAALRALIAGIEEGADLVIGSRYVAGGAIPNWPLYRRAMSRCGNRYASTFLGLPLADMTSGYRAYHEGSVRAIYRDPLRTQGYGALIEMVYRVAASGLRIVEVPITFVDRTRGDSKMSATIALETLWQVTRIGMKGRLGRRQGTPQAAGR